MTSSRQCAANARGHSDDSERLIFFHRESASLIVTDAIINIELDKMHQPWRTFTRMSGMYFPHGQVFSGCACRSCCSGKRQLRPSRNFTNGDLGASCLVTGAARALLRRLFEEIRESSEDRSRRAEARQAIAEVVERVELDPLTMAARLHYAVQTGGNVASPRRAEVTPVRWESEVIALARRKAA